MENAGIKVVHHEVTKDGKHTEKELKGKELQKWIEEHVRKQDDTAEH